MPNQPPPPDNSGLFRKGLNVHGFGFHYSVIKRILDIAREGLAWEFIGAEVPISLNGVETHADFIFLCRHKRIYLVGECKRADPSLAQWCFAKSRYAIGTGMPVTIDELHFSGPADKLFIRPASPDRWSEPYQVGVSIKTGQAKGDGCASDRKAISDAVTQVSRATNGFMQLCAENVQTTKSDMAGESMRVISAVFTTASLTQSDDDLSVADLASGNLPETAAFSPAQWLWFQHGLNRSLQAPIPGRFVAEQIGTWASYFGHSAVRSVAVVNVEGIHSFLDRLDRF